jgi:NADPH:quinone reductase-like Zn-dependent oxidoreductase
MTTTMHAVGFKQYGTADVLQLFELPVPKPAANKICVKVIAAGVNPADTSLRSGAFRLLIRLNLPFVPGSDVAGIVESVGDNVTAFQPGDAVYAMLPTRDGGAYAEYVTISAEHVAPAPSRLTFNEAAGVPLAGLTAYQALHHEAQVSAGQRVLIYGASGGVGSFAVQIAKHLGADVTAVCSTRNLKRVQALGANHMIDYTAQSMSDLNAQYDVVLDAVALLPLRQGIRLTERGGTLVTLNPGLGNPLSKGFVALFGRTLKAVMVQPDANDLRQLTTWIEAGHITPLIDRTYPLHQAADAHRYSETKRAQGKIILYVDSTQATQYGSISQAVSV